LNTIPFVNVKSITVLESIASWVMCDTWYVGLENPDVIKIINLIMNSVLIGREIQLSCSVGIT
jgi:hypothetical protein